MNYSTLRSWQRPSDPSIAQFVREMDAEQHRPYARPEFGDLAVTLEEDPDVDRILVDRPENAQVLDDEAIDPLTQSGCRASRSLTVMPGMQTCAWLADANSRSQFGHTQRVTSPIVPQQSHCGPVVASAARSSDSRSRVPAHGCCSPSAVSGLWRSLVAHLTGGQGVASSNLASPTSQCRIITPDQSRVHPATGPSSTSLSAGELGPDWAHQREYAAPTSSTAW